MVLAAMVAELLAVIRREHHDGVVLEAAFAEAGEQPTDLGVGVSDLAVVARPVAFLSEAFGEARVFLVDVVRVEVVHPEGPGLFGAGGFRCALRALVDPGQPFVGDLRRGHRHMRLASLGRSQLFVVVFEALVQPVARGEVGIGQTSTSTKARLEAWGGHPTFHVARADSCLCAGDGRALQGAMARRHVKEAAIVPLSRPCGA